MVEGTAVRGRPEDMNWGQRAGEQAGGGGCERARAGGAHLQHSHLRGGVLHGNTVWEGRQSEPEAAGGEGSRGGGGARRVQPHAPGRRRR